MRRPACLALAMALACGGRAVEPDDAAAGAGGSAGGRHTDGGATPTSGGADGSSAGGWLASGGAFASGGAVTTGGKSSVEDVLLMKYCDAYCTEASRTCLAAMGGGMACKQNCEARGKSNGSECQTSMIELLRCASNALFQAPDTCVDFPRAVSACGIELAAARRCGFSLPGAEACTTTFVGSDVGCTRLQRCGTMNFDVHCNVDASAAMAGCNCTVNTEQSFQVTWFDGIGSFDCDVAAVSMACGPDNAL